MNFAVYVSAKTHIVTNTLRFWSSEEVDTEKALSLG